MWDTHISPNVAFSTIHAATHNRMVAYSVIYRKDRHQPMNRTPYFHSMLPLAFLLLAGLACGLSNPASAPSAPEVPVAPISIGADLSQIDVCRAIPQEDIEAVMGRKLSAAPESFEYSETPGETSGCGYQAG